MKTLALLILSSLVAVSAAQTQRTSPPPDVVATIDANRSLTFLGTALRAGGFVQMLHQSGTYTIVAPSDRAFANISREDMKKLTATPAAMHFLLAHYFVRGTYASSNVAALSSAKTVTGGRLRAELRDGKVKLNGADVVKGDIACANGVIHVVDFVDPALVREAIASVSPHAL